MVDGLPGREVVREQTPGTAATHHVEDRVEDLAQGVQARARPAALGAGRWARSGPTRRRRGRFGMLFSSCPASYRDTASKPLFRRFLTTITRARVRTGC